MKAKNKERTSILEEGSGLRREEEDDRLFDGIDKVQNFGIYK